MNEKKDSRKNKPKLEKSGIARLITVFVFLSLQAAVLFIAAGRVDILRAWLYVGVTGGYLLIAIAVMFKFFPEVVELINERGKLKQDTKTWDKVFAAIYTPLVFIVPAVAGLDIGRFHWSSISIYFAIPGAVFSTFGQFLVHWAMVVNKYAETGVRIQEDRGQQVVSNGPYRFVRHPFYVSVIVTSLSFPLIVGSVYTYIPVTLTVLLFVVRTFLEDRTLQQELKGYTEYSQKVRYRLLPGVW